MIKPFVGTILAVAVSGATLGTTASASEPPLPAGQRARLHVVVESFLPGQSVAAHRFELDLPMKSEATSGFTLWSRELTTSQQAASAAAESGPSETSFEQQAAEMAAASEALTKTCTADRDSSDCRAAQARFQKINERLNNERDEYQSQRATASAADGDRHRFQVWQPDIPIECLRGSVQSSCGSLTTWGGSGSAGRFFAVRLALDRQTGSATLQLDPFFSALGLKSAQKYLSNPVRSDVILGSDNLVVYEVPGDSRAWQTSFVDMGRRRFSIRFQLRQVA